MANPHDLAISDYRALAEFRYQLRRFLHFSEAAARHSGLEPQHHQLMLAVKGMPAGRATRIAELAERLQLQHHSVVELVNRLVVKRLIRRSRDGEDRREVHVKLTARGERLLRELSADMHAELQGAGPELVAALRKITRRGSRPANEGARKTSLPRRRAGVGGRE